MMKVQMHLVFVLHQVAAYSLNNLAFTKTLLCQVDVEGQVHF